MAEIILEVCDSFAAIEMMTGNLVIVRAKLKTRPLLRPGRPGLEAKKIYFKGLRSATHGN
jgi:hypothetical protein